MKRLLAIFVPILLVTVALFAQQLELPLVSPKPVPIHDPAPAISLSGLKLPSVSPRIVPDYGPGQATGLPNLSLPLVSSTSPPLTPGGRLPSISLPPTEPDIIEPAFNDFTGGWNTENFPDDIEDKDALDIENFIWSKTGKLEPRPGYAFYNSSEIESGEHIWGLYRHYKRDRRSVLYVGTPDSLYVDTSQAQSGSFLSTGYGWTNNGEFFDFESFKDYCIVAHKGDTTRILDELDVLSLTFGFADSIEQILCSTLPFSGCTAFVCCDNVDWIPNQWAGYWLSKTMTPYDDNDYYTELPQMIVGNSEYVLYLVTLSGLPNFGPGYGWRYIFGFFDYDSVDAVIVDATSSLGGCGTDVIITDWSTADTIWDGGLHVIRMITGDAAGLEADIRILVTSEFPTDSAIFVSDLWGNSENISAGDTALILRSSFWKAELVKAHKNRLFMVVRNSWPESGQFIVFSEYNSVTHFDQDNFFFIRTDDGDKVTQLATFYQDQLGYKDDSKDGLVIFKENSIFVLTFNSPESYYLTQVVEGVGCMAGQTVQVIEGKYMLFLHSSGVYAFDGRTVTLLTKKIDSEIEDIERRIDHDECVAGYDDRHYYLSGPGFYDATYPGGEFICVFEMDQDQTTDGYWIHEFDSDGNEVGDDVRKLGADYAAIGDFLDIATKGDGEYAIMFKQVCGSPAYQVFLAFFDEDGVQIGDTLRLDDGGDDGYVKNADHKLDMNSAGQIMACWTDTEDGADKDDVRCQVVHFDSGLVGTNFNVNSDHASNIDDCSSWGVGINEEGIAVVAWHDQRDNANITEIYAQRFHYPDSLMGSNFRVNQCWTWIDGECVPCVSSPVCNGYNCCENEFKPAVAVGPHTFVIAWLSDAVGPHARCAGASCVYKRAYNLDGTAREGEILLSDCTGGNAQEPSISINSKGNYAIAYDKECGDGATYAIYMTAFDSSDAVRISETQVSSADESQLGPDVVINNNDIIVVVYYDGYHDAAVEIAYRSYDWNGALMASDAILSSSAYCQYPEIDCFLSPPDTTRYTLAWNIDYGGWSKMVNLGAGLYATQKGLTDTINMIFSDPANRSYVYEFGKVFQDTGQDISVVFKSKAFDFNSISNQKRVTRFFLNYYLDEGNFDLTFYTDFGDTSRYTSTVTTSGGYRYVRVPLDWTCRGRNFSYKIESTDDLRIDKIRLRLKIEED